MTDARLPRLLMALAAAVLLGAAVLHGGAFPMAEPKIEAAGMSSFYTNAYKAHWLVDSTNMLTLGLLYAFVAWRPSAMSRGAVLLSALDPLAASILLYAYMGDFVAGHLMLLAWVLALAGAALPRRSLERLAA